MLDPVGISNTPRVLFRKIDPEQNMKRYYSITLTRIFFDEWCIVCNWGRLGNKGQVRQYTFEDKRGAQILVDRLVKKRYARAYSIAH